MTTIKLTSSLSCAIKDQQSAADYILRQVEAIDPYCILAGGAPRDWHFGRLATDLDIFLHIPGFQTPRTILHRFEVVGFTGLKELSFHHESESGKYESNPLIDRIFEYQYGEYKVQFILMRESTFTSVVPNFPLTISQVWYKAGKNSGDEGMDALYPSLFSYTTERKAIVKINHGYADEDKYITRILARFPDFTYYTSIAEFTKAHLDDYKKLPYALRHKLQVTK